MSTGGRHVADQNDAEVQKVIQFAIDHLKRQSNSVYELQLHEVKKVETQVVSGVNYFLTLNVGGPNGEGKHDVEVEVYQGFDGHLEYKSHSR